MIKFLSKLEKETNKKYIMWVLGIISFFESLILPIPVDVFTFSLAAAQPKKWIKIGYIATISSIIGAFVAYFLGAYFFGLFGQHLIDLYGYQDYFNHVVKLFNNNTFFVMFTSAFTIIPFKVFTLTGGALRVNFIPFILASILGRGLRFFLEAYLAQRFGRRVTKHIIKKFNLYSIIFIILIIVYFIIRKFYL